MASLWSAVSPALPTSYLVGTFTRGFRDSVVRFETDRGPAPTRQRFAVGVRPESGAMLMTTAQLSALRTFYETTLAGGALSFEMFDPLGGAARLVRFAEPPAPEELRPGYWRVSLALEALP